MKQLSQLSGKIRGSTLWPHAVEPPAASTGHMTRNVGTKIEGSERDLRSHRSIKNVPP